MLTFRMGTVATRSMCFASSRQYEKSDLSTATLSKMSIASFKDTLAPIVSLLLRLDILCSSRTEFTSIKCFMLVERRYTPVIYS